MNSGHFYATISNTHDGVTGSCHRLTLDFPDYTDKFFLVDFGLFQEKEYAHLNKHLDFYPEDVDFVLVTHVHNDHVGRLPLLYRAGYNNKIYLSETSCRLMPVVLNDSLRILTSGAKRKKEVPLYSEKAVSDALSNLVPCGTETVKIDDNVKVTFIGNGHIPGASSILVQISFYGCEDINLFFSGDYNYKNTFFDVAPIPDWILKLPITIIMEATYGNMDSCDMSKSFELNILRWVSKDGTAVVPAFSLGRSQEVLYTLKCMQDAGSLNKDIPIYVDGKLLQKYTEMYLNGTIGIRDDMRKFMPENTILVNKANRPDILASKKRKVIVTSSGMGSYGPAQQYIPEYITRGNALIQFTGYAAEDTMAGDLKAAKIGSPVEFGGIVSKKNAEVEFTTEFSAHAKADEMIEFLNKFENIKLILLNHGTPETKKLFAERIVNEVKVKNVGILNSDYSYRVNQFGLVKKLMSDFT